MNVIQNFYIDFIVTRIKNYFHDFFIKPIIVTSIIHMLRENSIDNFLFDFATLSNYSELQGDRNSGVGKFTKLVYLTISNKFSNTLPIT